jgi:hypothetical protein
VVLITAFLRSVPSPCSAISPYTKRGAITLDARRIGLCCSFPLLSWRQWNRSVSVLHTSPSTGSEPVLTAAWQTANTFRLSTLIGWPSRVMQNHRMVFYCLLILNTGECAVPLGHQCTFHRITSVHPFIHSSFYSPHCPCVLCCKMARNFEHRSRWRVSVTRDVQSPMCIWILSFILRSDSGVLEVILFRGASVSLFGWAAWENDAKMDIEATHSVSIIWIELAEGLVMRISPSVFKTTIDWLNLFVDWCHWFSWLISIPKCSSNRL